MGSRKSSPRRSRSPKRRVLDSSPSLRINTTSSARQSPTIIAAPASPTKSIRADFMRSSQTSEASVNDPMPGDEVQPAGKSEQRNSVKSEDLLPEEKSPQHYSTHSLSFFDISDSSELSGTTHGDSQASHEGERPTVSASREDSMSTVRPIRDTRLNSKTSNISKASNLTDSQIDVSLFA